MKIKRIIWSFLLVIGMMFQSCNEDFLDVTPTETITADRLSEIANASPEALLQVLQPQMVGIYNWLIQYKSYTASTRHNDFGITALGLRMDLMTADMVQYTDNYGWFYSDYNFTGRDGYEYIDAWIPWNYHYKIIKQANDILMFFKEEPSSVELRYIRGQAAAMRAFAYWHLVQMYQHTYKGHENDPAVPIVTENTTEDVLGNNPRATVQAVYDLILSDLELAVKDLEGFVRTDKTALNKQIVQGFLARTYLNLEKWSEAAEYANAARQGFRLMTGNEYVELGFKDLSEPEWMWGCDVTDQSSIALSGIINFTSHISSLSYGYTTAGNMQKCIDRSLYESISSTDVRKKAFNGSDLIPSYGPNKLPLPPYANVKFGRYNISTNDNFNDYVLMRSAEMYLIEAEALAMQGSTAQAQDLLHQFMLTRDPNALKSKASGEALREEVYQQRRIELWGEGFSYYDYKRLRKPIVRNYEGSNHNEDARKNYDAEANVFRFLIPRAEITNNKGISEADNNAK